MIQVKGNVEDGKEAMYLIPSSLHPIACMNMG
jgi:hypothetical protein